MAITRGTWVDDDGSGTTGHIINNAWYQGLQNEIDAAEFRMTSTASGNSLPAAVNNYRPANGENCTLWILNGVAAVDITGILAEPDGSQHLILNTGGGSLTFQVTHANSAAANQIIGPGYATYALTSWRACWILYVGGVSKWVVLKET